MKTKSLLRIEEYKALSSLKIDGNILDVGGSKKSGYHELIKGNNKITVGNIDESYGIDIIFDAEKKWPIGDSSFDCILMMNLLEHLYDYRTALLESYRVLKKGGMLVGVVPFMFNVHGSPSDYFRYTEHALRRVFNDIGFKEIKITPLGTGAFSVIYHNMIGFFRLNWLAIFFMSIFKSLDFIINLLKPNNKMSNIYMPLGYFFVAHKR